MLERITRNPSRRSAQARPRPTLLGRSRDLTRQRGSGIVEAAGCAAGAGITWAEVPGEQGPLKVMGSDFLGAAGDRRSARSAACTMR